MKKKSSFEKPFNLLNKFEPQKTSIDKIYEFVVIQGRFIVVIVMLIIIVFFIYRFPLDAKLNNYVNEAKDLSLRIKSFEGQDLATEKLYRDLILRIRSLEMYTSLYSDDPSIDTTNTEKVQIMLSEFMILLDQVLLNYDNSIKLTHYSFEGDPEKGSILQINGYAKDSETVQQFREELDEIDKFVADTKTNDITEDKDEFTQFSLTINFLN